MKGEIGERRWGTALNFEIVSVSRSSDIYLICKSILCLITVLGCIIMFNPCSDTVILFTLSIELNAYLPSDHSVADLKCFHMLFFWRCHSSSSENRHSTILSLWPIRKVLIICCRALWKRHQPPNWTCVVQTQIKHLALSISPWVLSAY